MKVLKFSQKLQITFQADDIIINFVITKKVFDYTAVTRVAKLSARIRGNLTILIRYVVKKAGQTLKCYNSLIDLNYKYNLVEKWKYCEKVSIIMFVYKSTLSIGIQGESWSDGQCHDYSFLLRING